MATPKQQNPLYKTTADRFVEEQYNQTPQLGSASNPANDAPTEYYPSRVQNASSTFVSRGQKPKRFAANSNLATTTSPLAANDSSYTPSTKKKKISLPNTNPVRTAKAVAASLMIASWSGWLWIGVILLCIFEAIALGAAMYVEDSWFARAIVNITTWWQGTEDPMTLFYYLWSAQIVAVAIILASAYINYKVFLVNPLFGNGAGIKTGTFIATAIMCLCPIAAIIPWYGFWMVTVTIYPK